LAFDLEVALRRVIETGGSDLHLKVPSPPLIRVHGRLEPIPDTDKLMPSDLEEVFKTMVTDEKKRDEFEREVIPAPGRAIWQAALSNVTPNSIATINFRNNARAPLLFIGGEKDVLMPAALNRKNFRKYAASSAITEYKEFPGRSHYIIAEKGWEEVAQYALDWALAKSSPVQIRTED